MLIHELKIIRQALLNEQEGYDFYTLAANQVESQEAKEAFSQLAAEEQKHIEWLREMYKQLAANNPDGFDFTNIADPPAPGLYTKKNIGRESGSLAVSVFGIGVNMEKAAIDFYTAAAEQSQLPAAKRLYNNLIMWENQHLEKFLSEYESLKQDWWERQGFSPA
ncbi:MAG: ferritin family protein [Eubacteriales bacterium]|nr:ferritin family protein [Eubacteriales bacterium]MDD3074323.1 ferritin family protein [Eubacteriales bacterium]MDD4078664.1 ferritin family protein [Eubacteriales bacterium]